MVCSQNTKPNEDGWIFNSHVWAGMKMYDVYTRGNDLKVVNGTTEKIVYSGEVPDILVRDRYRNMIQKLKEAGI